MFPNKSGGVALYAHEAWRKYLTLIGPLATFGYWIGWSVVLSVNGLVAGMLLQSEFFSRSTGRTSGAGFDLDARRSSSAASSSLIVWLFNVFGVRPAVWFGYVTGGLLLHPGVRAHVPAVHHRRLVELEHDLVDRLGRRPRARPRPGCTSCAGRRTGSRWWRRSRPSSTTPSATRRRRCARRRCSAPRSTRCCRSASAARSAPTAVAKDSTFIAFYADAFDLIVGNALGKVMILCIVAGLVLSMNTATMDGSRALYGIAKDGMTIRQLGTLNRYHVPALAMTIDAILNLFLITYFGQPARDPGGEQRRLRVRDVHGALGVPAPAHATGPNWPRPVRLPN